jgi:hypothetical protein
MRVYVEVGRLRSAKGWLSKLQAEEALIVTRQLRSQGVRDIRIYDADSFAGVTEAELERFISKIRN